MGPPGVNHCLAWLRMSVRLGKFSDLAKSLPASALDFDCLNLFSFSGTFAGDLKKQRKRNTLGSRTVTGQATGCGGVSPCLECWNMWGNGCNRICYSNTCTRCRRNLQERPQSWLAESRRFSAFGICDFPDLPLYPHKQNCMQWNLRALVN